MPYRPLKRRHRLRRDPNQAVKNGLTTLQRQASARQRPDIVERCEEIKQALDQDYTVRAGPFEVKPRMMHPLWRKPPPEKP